MSASTISRPMIRSRTWFRSRWSSTSPIRKSSPYVSPKEIVAAAKKSPGKLTFATIGVGSGQHIVGAAFMKITGTQLLDVPYRGPALAYPDVLSGRVDLFFDSTPSALNYIKSGQVRGIGI